MKKIRIALITTVLVLCAAGAVFAAEFADVPQDAWYYKYVSELSDKGIVNGYGDGMFLPENNVTCAEALKLVLQSAGYAIENLVSDEEAAAFWGNNVVATAEKYGIVQKGTLTGRELATRLQISDFVVRANGWENSSHIESVFLDTDADSAEILLQKGIVNGIAELKGYSYYPNDNIKRSEISTIIYNVYNYDPLKLQSVTKGAEGCLVVNPATVDEFERVLIYMGVNNLTELSIAYTESISSYSYATRELYCKNLLEAQQILFDTYHEYFCYFNEISVGTAYANGVFSINVKLVNKDFSDGEVKAMRAKFFEEVEKAAESLVDDGLITSDMSDREKALVIYEWVCGKLEYDHSFGKESYFGYGGITNGKAVCQGYTALYNTMCKSFGIWCEGVSGTAKSGGGNESHIWTRANIDDEILYIDVTFGDTGKVQGTLCSYDYFCKDEKTFKKTHNW